MSLQPHPAWPFPTRHTIMSPQAESAIANPNCTPEQLEAAIKAQGALVEHHMSYGRREPAREAAKVVLQLNQMRTPETVARLEEEQGAREQ